MNLLLSIFDDGAGLAIGQHVEYWKLRRHLVESMSFTRLKHYLQFDPASTMALIDAIVCGADTSFVSFDRFGFIPKFPVAHALALAETIGTLPEACAMHDGRKWKAVPFIIFGNGAELDYDYSHLQPRVRLLSPHCNRYPLAALAEIQRCVSEHHDLILKDYERFGLLVRFEHGHIQIGPALKKKDATAESAYYWAGADKRSHRNWVTVKRDREGLSYDVDMFQALLEKKATETEMHRFLEQHPAFLMEAMFGVPLSHKPVFSKPKRATPDYVLSPILGPSNQSAIELLELKGPSEPLLSGPRLHRGFTRKLHQAIDQVRDYDDYLRDPENHISILRSLGHVPTARSKLAVLIGRNPRGGAERDSFAARKAQVDVRIVTYDEILEIQTNRDDGLGA